MASLVLAVRFLTIVPVPGREAAGPGALGRAAWWFPAVGLALGGGLMLADRALAAVVPPLLVGRAGRGGLEGVDRRHSPRRARGLPRRAGRRERRAPAGDHARQPHRRLRGARARAVPVVRCAALAEHARAARGPDPGAGSGGRPARPAARRAALFARPRPARASARRSSPRSPAPPGPLARRPARPRLAPARAHGRGDGGGRAGRRGRGAGRSRRGGSAA